MTCKDCIHYEACEISSVYFGEEKGNNVFREYEKRKNVELDCDQFKDKSRFVELPCRCENCIYSTTLDAHCELNRTLYLHCSLWRGDEINNVWHKYKKYYKDYSIVEKDGYCDDAECKLMEVKINERSIDLD